MWVLTRQVLQSGLRRQTIGLVGTECIGVASVKYRILRLTLSDSLIIINADILASNAQSA